MRLLIDKLDTKTSNYAIKNLFKIIKDSSRISKVFDTTEYKEAIKRLGGMQ